MDIPRPSERHAALAVFAGEWEGDEILYPSPWAPEERRAKGRFRARMGLDGFFLVTDYEEERDGAIVFRGHGVYGWDPSRQRYTMHWFDSSGVPPSPTLGQWEGDTLTYESRSERGHSRYVYEWSGRDAYTFRILTSPDGETWSPMMEGRYRRIS